MKTEAFVSKFVNEQQSLQYQTQVPAHEPERYTRYKPVFEKTIISMKTIQEDGQIQNQDMNSQTLRNRYNSSERSSAHIIVQRDNQMKQQQTNFLDEKSIKLQRPGTRFNGKKKKVYGRELKQIVKKQKINNLVGGFIQKLKRNNVFMKKIEFNFSSAQMSEQWWNFKGFQLNQRLLNSYDFLTLLFQFIQAYFFTLIVVFSLESAYWARVFQVISLVVCFLQIGMNMVTEKISGSKRLIHVKDIFLHDLTEDFILDFILLLVLFVNVFHISQGTHFLKFIVLFKIPWCFERLQKLEIRLIQSTYKQQYWSVIKIFLFNFCFAYMLALILYGMSRIDPQHSWLTQIKLYNPDQNPAWAQIYIWAYYWGVNMMLTVGLGDIVASNYKQALILIFVETLSCIVLAYNINFVGSLISNIRQQDMQKCKKYKIFRSLAIKHKISNDLFLKVANYIEQSNNIKKKFNIQQQNKFVQSLPRIFKKDYLSESNKSIFENIFFFCNLTDKAIQSLAESIQITIAHPDELILGKEDYKNLKILKQGSVGYCIKKSGCLFNGKIIDRIQIKQGQSPFLISLNFITNNRPIFEVKSLEYSINYSLTYEKLIESMKRSKGDYQYYCYLKDKSKHIPDEFQIFQCPNCRVFHTKFHCPLIHFVPIHQHVLNKYIKKTKKSRNARASGMRIETQRFSALKIYISLNKMKKLQRNQITTLKKNKDFIIGQLVNVEKFQSEKSFTQMPSMRFTQIIYKSSAAESIKDTLTQYFRKAIEQDPVWFIALDLMENFKGYFPNDNPSNIENKFAYNHQWHSVKGKAYCEFHTLRARSKKSSSLFTTMQKPKSPKISIRNGENQQSIFASIFGSKRDRKDLGNNL